MAPSLPDTAGHVMTLQLCDFEWLGYHAGVSAQQDRPRAMPLHGIEFIPERVDQSQIPSRARLRVRGTRDAPNDNPPIAHIEVLQQGGYNRPVITRGGLHARGRFRSQKTGLTQVFEGNVEPILAMRNEVDALVIDYQCHPFRIHLTVNGKRHTYSPDAIRVMADGRIELIEAKRTAPDLRDPEYREILATVKEICRQCGWHFRVLYLSDVAPTNESKHNIETLFGRLFGALTSKEERTCEMVRKAGKPISWGDLRAKLSDADPRHGDAVIEAAAAKGFFSFDLDRQRTCATILHPVLPFKGKSAIRF